MNVHLPLSFIFCTVGSIPNKTNFLKLYVLLPLRLKMPNFLTPWGYLCCPPYPQVRLEAAYYGTLKCCSLLPAQPLTGCVTSYKVHDLLALCAHWWNRRTELHGLSPRHLAALLFTHIFFWVFILLKNSSILEKNSFSWGNHAIFHTPWPYPNNFLLVFRDTTVYRWV